MIRNQLLMQFQADILGRPVVAATDRRDERPRRRLRGGAGGRVLGRARRAALDGSRRPTLGAGDGRGDPVGRYRPLAEGRRADARLGRSDGVTSRRSCGRTSARTANPMRPQTSVRQSPSVEIHLPIRIDARTDPIRPIWVARFHYSMASRWTLLVPFSLARVRTGCYGLQNPSMPSATRRAPEPSAWTTTICSVPSATTGSAIDALSGDQTRWLSAYWSK